jgi:hypothetical protein
LQTRVSGSKYLGAEVIQARELENRKDLGDYMIFMCRLCQLFLDIKEKSSTGKIERKN